MSRRGSTSEAEHQGSEGSGGRQDGCYATSLRLEEVAEVELDLGEERPTEEQAGQHPKHPADKPEEARLEEVVRQLGWADRW